MIIDLQIVVSSSSHQKLPQKDPQDPLARQDQQWRTVATNETATCGRWHPQKTLEVDWTHPPQVCRQYHKPSPQTKGLEKACWWPLLLTGLQSPYSFDPFPDLTLGMCVLTNPIQPVTALYKGLMPLQITFAPQMLCDFIVFPIPLLKWNNTFHIIWMWFHLRLYSFIIHVW